MNTIVLPQYNKLTLAARATRNGKRCNARVIKIDNTFKAQIAIGTKEKGYDYMVVPFTKGSWELKGRPIIFSREKDETNHYVAYMRDIFYGCLFGNDPKKYTPFSDKIIISGYLVRVNGNLQFEYTEFVAFNDLEHPITPYDQDEIKPITK